MKKFICISLVLLALVGCLSACDIEGAMKDLQGTLQSQSESAPKVEEMMSAIEEKRTSDAMELMHPDVADKSEAAIEQMVDFLAGRTVVKMEMKSINLNSSTDGKTENLVYVVTLDDDNSFYINAEYISNDDGEGFSVFQFVIGTV